MKPTVITINKAYRQATLACDPAIATAWAQKLTELEINFTQYIAWDEEVSIFSINFCHNDRQAIEMVFTIDAISAEHSWQERQSECLWMIASTQSYAQNQEIELVF